VKKFLRSILDAARASKEKPAGARSMLEIVRQEGEWFRFAFRDDKGRLWSERLRAFLWHRLFLESLVTPELIERLGQARDAPDDLARIGHRAERLGKQVWAEIVRITPEEADAADLGQDSKAASEFLEAIHAVWTTSKTMETNRDGTHRTASTLVAAGAHKAGLFTDGKWHQVHPPLAAWARLEGKTLELAMRHELFRQVGINPPARVRDFETFRRLATRYGACDRTSKVGKQAGMGVVLPARITEELLASFGEAE
jgi:hypothetical protein